MSFMRENRQQDLAGLVTRLVGALTERPEGVVVRLVHHQLLLDICVDIRDLGPLLSHRSSALQALVHLIQVITGGLDWRWQVRGHFGVELDFASSAHTSPRVREEEVASNGTAMPLSLTLHEDASPCIEIAPSPSGSAAQGKGG
jgi:hypothetical protein